MSRLLLGMFVEALVAVSLAGVLLALIVPALSRGEPTGQPDLTTTVVIAGGLVAAVATALFRSRSALRRHFDRLE